MKERYNVRVILHRKTRIAKVSGDPGNSNKEFLLLLARKGYCQFPQGGIESGEKVIDAARREVLEETNLRIRGMDISSESLVQTIYFAERKGEPVKIFLRAIAAEVMEGSDDVFLGNPNGDGHKDWQWVSYSRAYDLLVEYPEQRKVFEEVCKKAKLQ